MIGNNACGPHAVAYGRTADNVEALNVLDGSGRRYTAGNRSRTRGEGGPDQVAGLDLLIDGHRTSSGPSWKEYVPAPDIRLLAGSRLAQVAEHGRDLAKALVGSAGNNPGGHSGYVKLRLVLVSPAQVLVVLGMPTWHRLPTPVRLCSLTHRSRWKDSMLGSSRSCADTEEGRRCLVSRVARVG